MHTPIKRAIFIDDDEVDQRAFKRITRRSGLIEETMFFSLATDALAFLRKTPNASFDVLFLDINMPLMNGFEFLEELSSIKMNGPFKGVVVMLTTSLSRSDEARAASFDMVRAYIYKPLTVQHIEQVADLQNDPSQHDQMVFF